MITKLIPLHKHVFNYLEAALGDWFMGLSARLIFSSTVMMFLLNSAGTKLGSGFPEMLQPTINAYAQILPPIAEAAGYDVSKISFFPWTLIVYAGIYAEILIPVAIFLGLFTRLASLAMIGFIAVMSFVDIVFHKVDHTAIGMFFDSIPDSIILDQRLLWMLPLFYLILHGGGRISLDYWLGRIIRTQLFSPGI